jgi:hypothetical protein
VIGHDAVEAEGGDEGGQDAEEAGEGGEETFADEARAEGVVEGSGLEEDLGADGGDGVAEGFAEGGWWTYPDSMDR